MDIKLLFSRQPFVQQRLGAMNEARGEVTFDLPEEYRSANVVVEIVSGGIRQAQAHYAHVLAVQVIEGYGQVHVTHQETGAPLSGAVVVIRFEARYDDVLPDRELLGHREGYADERGQFEVPRLVRAGLSAWPLMKTEARVVSVIRDGYRCGEPRWVGVS